MPHFPPPLFPLLPSFFDRGWDPLYVRHHVTLHMTRDAGCNPHVTLCGQYNHEHPDKAKAIMICLPFEGSAEYIQSQDALT